MSSAFTITNPRIRNTNDVYRLLYCLYGYDVPMTEVQRYFPVSESKGVYKLFTDKLHKIGGLFDKRMMATRIRSANARKVRERSLLETSDGSITQYSVIELLERQVFQCALCKIYLIKSAHKQLDHIIPVSKGGRHVLQNVQWLCRACNLKKSDKIYGSPNG